MKTVKEESERRMRELRDKLRGAMDSGHDGPPVLLSPMEATVCYRHLFGDKSLDRLIA